MTQQAPYPVEKHRVGILKRLTVQAVLMPRSHYLEDVTALINEIENKDERAAIHERLWPVALKMRRFPLHSWVHEERGCGCLVGEYLIAADVIERSEGSYVDVEREMQQSDIPSRIVRHLYRIGNEIDAMIDGRIEDSGTDLNRPLDVVVVFQDETAP